HRAAKSVAPIGELDGPEPVDVSVVAEPSLLGGGVEVDGVRRRIDYGSARDADFGPDASVDIAVGDRVDAGDRVDEAVFPEDLPVVRVDGIEAVVFGRHEDDIVNALMAAPRDVDAELVQRLRVNLAVE